MCFPENCKPREGCVVLRFPKGPPTEIPASDLTKVIGTATWTQTDVLYGVPAYDLKTSDFKRKPITCTTKFNVKRKKVWALSDAPHHFAQDKTLKITTVQGYSRIEKVTFARTLNVSSSGSFFGFRTEVQTSLQLTNETQQQWKEERTEETETTFHADHWYASWTLLDILDGMKHMNYDWGLPETDAKATFKVIISLYDNTVKDTDIQFVASNMTRKKLSPLGPI